MPKFSDTASAEVSAEATVVADQAKLVADQASEATAHEAIVAALKAKGSPVGLPQADGSIVVYALTSDGTSYTTTTISGDFDV